jgi:hypothetical protein
MKASTNTQVRIPKPQREKVQWPFSHQNAQLRPRNAANPAQQVFRGFVQHLAGVQGRVHAAAANLCGPTLLFRMDATPQPPSLLDLPDECLIVLVRQLAQQDRRSLRRLGRTNSRLHALTLPLLSGSISSCLQTRKQLESLLRHLQRHGHLNSRLSLQGRPSEWEFGNNGSYGICSVTAPHIRSWQSPCSPAWRHSACSTYVSPPAAC